MKDPLAEITWDFQEQSISFTDSTWLTGIPATPGWYLIATTAPLEALAGTPPPPLPGRHYDIPGRVAACAELLRRDLAIRPEAGALTVVYSGQAKNL